MRRKIFLLIVLALIISLVVGCGKGETPKKKGKSSGFSEVAAGKIVYIKGSKAYAVRTDGTIESKSTLEGISKKLILQTVLLSRDGKRIAYNYGSKLGSKWRSTFAVADMASGKQIASINKSMHSRKAGPTPVIASDSAWSPDGSAIILTKGSDAGIFKIEPGEYKDLGVMVTGDISWSSDNRYIVSSGIMNRFLAVYDVNTGNVTHPFAQKGMQFKFYGNDQFLCLREEELINPQGMKFTMCRMDFEGGDLEELSTITLESGKKPKNLPLYESLMVSTNGERVLFVGGGGLSDGYYIYTMDSDGENPKKLAKLKPKKRNSGKDSWFRRKAFLSPDGEWVVYSESDGIYAIKIETGQRERIARGINLMLAGWSE